MIVFIRFLIILLLFLSPLGCQRLGLSKRNLIKNDAILIDLQEEVDLLDQEVKKMKDEEKKILTFITSGETSLEVKAAMKKELSVSKRWQKKIFELKAYRIIKINRRLDILNSRINSQNDYSSVTNQEEKAYFQNKRLNPMKKDWENRYRAAVDLNP